MTPFLRSWARSCAAAAPPVPVPSGPPLVAVDGPDPDRVLLVGGGPAAGSGAPDHDAALTGALARALSQRTGRGTVVESRGAHLALMEDLPALVASAQLRRFDAVVVCIGVEDAAAGAAVRTWRRRLAEVVDGLQRDAASDAVVVLVRIPPVSSVRIYRGAPAVLGDLVARRLNRACGHVARGRDRVVQIALPKPVPGAGIGTPAWHETCGRALAEALGTRFGAGAAV